MLQSPNAIRAKIEEQVDFPCLLAVSPSNFTLSPEGNVVLVKMPPGTGDWYAQPDKINAAIQIKTNLFFSIFLLFSLN